MKSLILVWLFVILALTHSFGDVPDACKNYYSQGVAAYENENFPQAIQFFESCESEGVESWVLFYNLGNAWYRNGSMGKAILNYEKSLLLNPGEVDVLANLEFARALIKDKQEETLFSTSILDTWYRYMTLNTSFLVVLVVVGVIFLCIALVMLFKGPARFAVYPVIIGSAFVLLIVSASIGFRLYQLNSLSHGVLTSETASVYSGPGKTFEVLFEIHEGTKFEIVEENDTWLSINLGNGKMGYIAGDGVGVVH